MAVSMIFTICLTAIAIGSTVAYGIFVSLNASGLLTSYIICIGCMYWLDAVTFTNSKLTNLSYPPQATKRRTSPCFSIQSWKMGQCG